MNKKEIYFSLVGSLDRTLNFFGFKRTGKKLSKIYLDRPSLQFCRERWGYKELVGVEVGVWKGKNAKNILSHFNMRKLYLIDYWDRSITNEGKKRTQDEFNKIKEYVYNYFSVNKKVQIINKLSLDAVKDIEEEVDFVYIDSSHDYETTIKEIKAYYPLIVHGGVLCGHDVKNLPIKSRGVLKAVYEFANENNLIVFIDQPDWWIIKP
ncbi:hypothetical protein COU57_02275 [Candidatus Pacearchaeota archaeon CG10_big_fil_rev_8_21_14_0_10_32_14]|nr:MAG: hypothetical protein COU57_02275 [Candidatus Pacearchaeota archaeon CG10_big_fil_rev_8_21_14_0_10_32_14]